MMYLHERLNIGYIEDLKTQILELPYAGDVSMFLLLPDEIANVSTGLELVRHSNFNCFRFLGSELTFHDELVYTLRNGLQFLTEICELVDSKCGMSQTFIQSLKLMLKN